MNGYTIKVISNCIFVFGEFPIADFGWISGRFPERESGEAVMDIHMANLYGATLVVGYPEEIGYLRELSPEQIGLPLNSTRVMDSARALQTTGNAGLAKWLLKGERGASSEVMSRQFFGIPEIPESKKSHPLDYDDFKRCMKFLSESGSKDRLPEMGTVSSHWAALVDHWEEIGGLINLEVKSGDENRKSVNDLIRKVLSKVGV